ncbi:uncharacterized protein BJ212DRAFT_1306699 [Suillus subaureus]|uniref:Uncharacterized protein n=1 Tax=Suillus subaureus TaxID=48587 RepID=A0A9P7ARG0_9AGAM|nr:uncharacterized protein BJ212DRAFT_1306699 [Suillus subaureus]KAG1794971.1 hypothetical protein BJ212DRAFT_1306699 [Suillus subaureus]
MHISNLDIPMFKLHDMIGNSLSQNKSVALRGIGHHDQDVELTLEYLEEQYAISPNRAVWIHGSISPLYIPLAQVLLPDCVSIVHGWNENTYDIPITSSVHPENFTVKGWGLVYHAGYITYLHHNAEGILMWLIMDVGVKFWVLLCPKD